MSKARKLYDTRFFFEHYYSDDRRTLEKTRQEIRLTKKKYLSAVTIHELYFLILEREGKDVAELRVNLLKKDFQITAVNIEIAKTAAVLRRKYRVPMADSLIAATAKQLNVTCITDDLHLTKIKEIKTAWIT